MGDDNPILDPAAGKPVKKARFWKTQRYASPKMNLFVAGTACASAGLLLLTLTGAIIFGWCPCTPGRQIFLFVALLIWGLFPPLVFWAEYHWCWLPSQTKPLADPERRASFEEFKYSHEVGRNIWLAVVAGLVVLYKLD
jgi:hypothetical protein